MPGGKSGTFGFALSAVRLCIQLHPITHNGILVLKMLFFAENLVGKFIYIYFLLLLFRLQVFFFLSFSSMGQVGDLAECGGRPCRRDWKRKKKKKARPLAGFQVDEWTFRRTGFPPRGPRGHDSDSPSSACRIRLGPDKPLARAATDRARGGIYSPRHPR